ncbi:MAG TPA: hypothetical protein VMO75_05785, partial [Chthoniobacterales bacterium]|nr:hypothetical protein [Chthoniobacterales bacterium]
NRWMGEIWEVVNTYVSPAPLGGTSSSGLVQAGFTNWNLAPSESIGLDANGNLLFASFPAQWADPTGGYV